MIFEKILEFLNKITSVFITGIIIFMSLILLLQIVSRFLVFMPLPWSQELLQYLNIWLVFLGASVAVKEQAHIKIDFVVVALPAVLRKSLRVFAYLSSLVLVSLVATQAYTLMGKTMGTSLGSFPVPMAYFYLSLLSGCILMAVNYFFLIYSEFRAVREEA